MKIKALTRSMDAHAPARKGDAPIVSHNLDPAMHPFSKPREYTRAVNAAKLDRMHAKPFVNALEGHVDGVYCLARDPNRLGVIASGSGDGGELSSRGRRRDCVDPLSSRILRNSFMGYANAVSHHFLSKGTSWYHLFTRRVSLELCQKLTSDRFWQRCRSELTKW